MPAWLPSIRFGGVGNPIPGAQFGPTASSSQFVHEDCDGYPRQVELLTEKLKSDSILLDSSLVQV